LWFLSYKTIKLVTTEVSESNWCSAKVYDDYEFIDVMWLWDSEGWNNDNRTL